MFICFMPCFVKNTLKGFAFPSAEEPFGIVQKFFIAGAAYYNYGFSIEPGQDVQVGIVAFVYPQPLPNVKLKVEV